ncbi:hypothetical protein ABK040_009365 [Willaertia magna]
MSNNTNNEFNFDTFNVNTNNTNSQQPSQTKTDLDNFFSGSPQVPLNNNNTITTSSTSTNNNSSSGLGFMDDFIMGESGWSEKHKDQPLPYQSQQSDDKINSVLEAFDQKQ